MTAVVASIGGSLLTALSFAFGMFWEILWALILGFALSAAVQAVVSCRASTPVRHGALAHWRTRQPRTSALRRRSPGSRAPARRHRLRCVAVPVVRPAAHEPAWLSRSRGSCTTAVTACATLRGTRSEPGPRCPSPPSLPGSMAHGRGARCGPIRALRRILRAPPALSRETRPGCFTGEAVRQAA
jgi:hypothetical protein